MTNEEEYRRDIDEQEVYRLLVAHWRSEATRFGGRELVSEDEVAEYVQAWERQTGF